ncbi:MAG TPA: GNAT family N-acetyltransferase [Stenomitos sp.]
MSLSIKAIRPARSDEWDTIWRECEYSTYFHSREWVKIWESFTQGKFSPKPKLIIFSDEKQALLPLCLQRYGGFISKQASSLEETFGGWISTDNLSISHANLLANFLTKKLGGSLSWRLNPYEPLAFKTGVVGIKLTKEDETHAIHLEAGFDALYKKQSSIVRKARKAAKEGVTVTIASTQKEWQEYYQVYQDSLRRWGKEVSLGYPWELFLEILQQNSPNIKLWVARYENKIVSGALCFYAKKHVVYWQGASLEGYFQLRPVNLLMYEIIKNCCEAGYSWFDFNPSDRLEGVIAFKESFGAKPLPSPVIIIETKLQTLLIRLKAMYEKRIIKKN